MREDITKIIVGNQYWKQEFDETLQQLITKIIMIIIMLVKLFDVCLTTKKVNYWNILKYL